MPSEADIEAGAQVWDDLVAGQHYKKQEQAEFWMRLDTEERKLMDQLEDRKGTDDDFINNALEYMLRAPLVEIPGSPMAQLIIRGYKAHRILKADECLKNKMCTEFEAYGYIMCASVLVPFTTDSTDMAEYLFRKYFPEGAIEQDIKETRHNKELRPEQQKLLDGLREAIFKTQIQHVKNLRKRDYIPQNEKNVAQATLGGFT